ncbi:prepilin-type N-terminal cleavage/methylation domain-containing protein [Patescibacteria group bacterium]
MHIYRPNNPHRRGFTLIELLAVIAIIGLLATISAVAVNRARHAARVAAAQEDLAQLRTAVLLLENDTGKWPSGCPPYEDRTPEVDVRSAQAALMVEPVPGSYSGCDWTSQEVDNWQGPYVHNIDLDPWGNPYEFDPDYFPYQNCGSEETLNEGAAIISYGPNGEGRNDYDCDDVFLRLD